MENCTPKNLKVSLENSLRCARFVSTDLKDAKISVFHIYSYINYFCHHNAKILDNARMGDLLMGAKSPELERCALVKSTIK